MPIISISLNEKILEEVEKIQKELGFSGRSEIIRAGLRTLIAENKERQKLVGKIKAILLLVHNESAESTVSDIKHKFEDILNTQIHSKLQGEKCLEVFILDGDSSRVKELIKHTQSSKRIDYVKLIVP